MKYSIIYHANVASYDVSRLDRVDSERVRKAIEQKLIEKPEVFGVPLRRDLSGFFKLRVGDYRVVFRIEKADAVVKIFVIAHRSIVYTEINKRF